MASEGNREEIFKETAKSSFQEIKEVDEEYLYSSGIQSSDNTDRLLTDNPSAFLKQYSNSNSNKKLQKKMPTEANTQNISFPIINPKFGGYSSMNEIEKNLNNEEWYKSEKKFEISNDQQVYLAVNNKFSIEANPKNLSPFVTSTPRENFEKENGLYQNKQIASLTIHSQQAKDSPLNNPYSSQTSKNILSDHYKMFSNHNTTQNTPDADSLAKKVDSNPRLFLKEKKSVDYTKQARNSNTSTEFTSSTGKNTKMLKKFVSNKDLSSGVVKEIPEFDTHTCREAKKNYSSFYSQNTSKTTPHPNQNTSNGFACRNQKSSASNDNESKFKKKQEHSLLKTNALPFQRQSSVSEVSGFFRKSEDRIKTKIISQNSTFNNLIQNLKRGSLKSPKKYNYQLI